MSSNNYLKEPSSLGNLYNRMTPNVTNSIFSSSNFFVCPTDPSLSFVTNGTNTLINFSNNVQKNLTQNTTGVFLNGQLQRTSTPYFDACVAPMFPPSNESLTYTSLINRYNILLENVASLNYLITSSLYSKNDVSLQNILTNVSTVNTVLNNINSTNGINTNVINNILLQRSISDGTRYPKTISQSSYSPINYSVYNTSNYYLPPFSVPKIPGLTNTPYTYQGKIVLTGTGNVNNLSNITSGSTFTNYIVPTPGVPQTSVFNSTTSTNIPVPPSKISPGTLRFDYSNATGNITLSSNTTNIDYPVNGNGAIIVPNYTSSSLNLNNFRFSTGSNYTFNGITFSENRKLYGNGMNIPPSLVNGVSVVDKRCGNIYVFSSSGGLSVYNAVDNSWIDMTSTIANTTIRNNLATIGTVRKVGIDPNSGELYVLNSTNILYKLIINMSNYSCSIVKITLNPVAIPIDVSVDVFGNVYIVDSQYTICAILPTSTSGSYNVFNILSNSTVTSGTMLSINFDRSNNLVIYNNATKLFTTYKISEPGVNPITSFIQQKSLNVNNPLNISVLSVNNLNAPFIIGGSSIGTNSNINYFIPSTVSTSVYNVTQTNTQVVTNNVSWSATPFNILSECNCVHSNGIMWLAGGVGFNPIIYSVDGVNWFSSNNSQNLFSIVNNIIYNGSVWIACGSDTSIFKRGMIAYSIDGITWNRCNFNHFYNYDYSSEALPVSNIIDYNLTGNLIDDTKYGNGTSLRNLVSYNADNWNANTNNQFMGFFFENPVTIKTIVIYAVSVTENTWNPTSWSGVAFYSSPPIGNPPSFDSTKLLPYTIRQFGQRIEYTLSQSYNGNEIYVYIPKPSQYQLILNGIRFYPDIYSPREIATQNITNKLYPVTHSKFGQPISTRANTFLNIGDMVSNPDNTNKTYVLSFNSDGSANYFGTVNTTDLRITYNPPVFSSIGTNGGLTLISGKNFQGGYYSSTDGINWQFSGMIRSNPWNIYAIEWTGNNWVLGGGNIDDTVSRLSTNYPATTEKFIRRKDDTNYPGGDLISTTIGMNTEQDCYNLALNYTAGNVDGYVYDSSAKRCWLKQNMLGSVSQSGFKAGIRVPAGFSLETDIDLGAGSLVIDRSTASIKDAGARTVNIGGSYFEKGVLSPDGTTTFIYRDNINRTVTRDYYAFTRENFLQGTSWTTLDAISGLDKKCAISGIKYTGTQYVLTYMSQPGYYLIIPQKQIFPSGSVLQSMFLTQFDTVTTGLLGNLNANPAIMISDGGNIIAVSGLQEFPTLVETFTATSIGNANSFNVPLRLFDNIVSKNSGNAFGNYWGVNFTNGSNTANLSELPFTLTDSSIRTGSFPSTTPTVWFQIQLSSPIYLYGMKLTSVERVGNRNSSRVAPRSFVLLGSVNGNNWNIIYTCSNNSTLLPDRPPLSWSTAGSETKFLYLQNPSDTSYSYFRFVILEGGDGTFCALDEFRLIGANTLLTSTIASPMFVRGGAWNYTPTNIVDFDFY